MSEEFKVHVCQRKGRRHLVLRYIDPTTGLKREKATKITRRREAERLAGSLESDLRNGRHKPPSKVLWSEFREEYEKRLERKTSDSTVALFGYVANVLERTINAEKLGSVNRAAMARFVNILHAAGKSVWTIHSYVGTLLTGLRWAKTEGMLTEVPVVELPEEKVDGKVVKEDRSGGRPITGEEFDRFLAAVPRVLFADRKDGRPVTIDLAVVESWRHLLRGLFWSGLRIGEAHLLTWDDDDLPSVDFSEEHPTMWLPGRYQKNGIGKHCAIVPEFFDFLRETPELKRTGFVFNPVSPKTVRRPSLDTFKRKIADIGREARVKVKDLASGKVKFCSAHDLRRTFALRWSQRVTPSVLAELMRHRDTKTAEKYYATANAAATSKVTFEAVFGPRLQPKGDIQVTSGVLDEKRTHAEST